MAVLRRDDGAGATSLTPDLNALLGRGCEFEGKLTFEGKVRIDGRFDGQIVTDDVLIIGEEARITAEIACGTLVCNGEVIGNVRAKTGVELHRPARLKGNVTTPSLMIEKGVHFEGQSKMEPAESARTADTAPANVTAIGAASRLEQGAG